MGSTDFEVLSHFEEVWQRVQRGQTERKESREAALEALMDGLHFQWSGTRQLAKCTCGAEKRCMQELSERIKKQFYVLQLYYFLKTGDIYHSSVSPNFASYTPYNLRKLWQSTVENAETLKNCNLNDDLDLVAELREMEEEIERQKMEIKELIGRLLR